MTQFAGRATFPAAFTDARGNGRGGLSITVYHRPTYLDGVTNGTALLLSATAEFESSNEGLAITGEDIAPSTTIEEYLSPTSVLLSQPATGSGTGRSFQVIGRQRAEDLATVYTDRTKGVADANPFVADSAGNAWPYLDPGDYDAVTVHGITPFTVLRDPGEPVAESDLAFAIATQGELDAEAATRSAEVAALTAADATETAARIAADALKADDNAVVKLTGNQTIAGTKTFSAAPVAPGVLVRSHPFYDATHPAYGAVFDNATDDTAALQAVHDDAPAGATIVLPPRAARLAGILALTKPHVWQGSGWDVTSWGFPFGAGGWTSRVEGTVLRSERTTGAGISYVPVNSKPLILRDLAVLGPGSGSSVGVAYGDSVAHPRGGRWTNVAFFNWATGSVWDFAIDCVGDGLRFGGCSKAWRLQNNCNQATAIDTQIDACGDGLDVVGSTLLLFLSGVIQGCSGGRGFRTENSYGVTLDSFYFENANGLYAIDLDSGGGHEMRMCHLGIPGKDIVRVNCAGNVFRRFQQAAALTYTANGNANFIDGPWAATITDGGTGNTWRADSPVGQLWSGQAPFFASGVNLGTVGDMLLTRSAANELSLSSVLRILLGASNVDIYSLSRSVRLFGGGADGIVLRNHVRVDGDANGVWLRSGSGAPNNAVGANGDIYLRVDGASGATLYQRRSGTYVVIDRSTFDGGTP